MLRPELCITAAQLYGVPKEQAAADRRLLDRRLDLAHSAAVLLDKNNLIKYDRRSGNFQVCTHSNLCICTCTCMTCAIPVPDCHAWLGQDLSTWATFDTVPMASCGPVATCSDDTVTQVVPPDSSAPACCRPPTWAALPATTT